MVLSSSLLSAIETVTGALRTTGAKWLLGGSSGLLLHEIDLDRTPRDLDIYFDDSDVLNVFSALKSYAVGQPHFSATEIYESTLSHYLIADIQVEGVGAFRVHTMESRYAVEAEYLYDTYRIQASVGCETAPLMPLAHELLFNILRDRPDRYEAIASAMCRNRKVHLPACMDLLQRNQWGADVIRRIERLLDLKL